MAQAKKKTATKTTKKPASCKGGKSCKKSCTRTQCKDITTSEKIHVYIVTAMAMIAGILLCANVACMMV